MARPSEVRLRDVRLRSGFTGECLASLIEVIKAYQSLLQDELVSRAFSGRAGPAFLLRSA